MPQILSSPAKTARSPGWSPTVPLPAPSTVAHVAVDDASSGAVFKGLAIGTSSGSQFIYATDFHNNHIDVFNSTFGAVVPAGSFTDPNMPAGFAPFGIQNIGNQLFVTYAKQDGRAHDDVPGAGNGFVDVYVTSGHLLERLVSGGALNSPWGLAMAPANFGQFSNDLLVGNFGDGTIHAYDPTTGNLLGTVGDKNGDPLVIDGLWALQFGNGLFNQPTNSLFFTSGPGGERTRPLRKHLDGARTVDARHCRARLRCPDRGWSCASATEGPRRSLRRMIGGGAAEQVRGVSGVARCVMRDTAALLLCRLFAQLDPMR